MNETIYDEENSSEAEDDTSEEQNLNQMQTYENNGEQNKCEDKLLTTNFEVYMCLYVTTENPNVMMREYHNTQSSE